MFHKIYWTRQAREDLREIRAFIARDAPLTAAAFIRRLRASVVRLRSFPQSGQVVPELGDEGIRELIRGHYRIIYRFRVDRVEILTVYHSSRLLDDTQC
jgi:plasmid stabilization system protein ParE